MAIHLTHRLGALVTLLTVGAIALFTLKRARVRPVRVAAAVTLAVLAAQITLGIAVVVNLLPLELAVAHNLTAALLLLSTVTLAHVTWRHRQALTAPTASITRPMVASPPAFDPTAREVTP